MQNQPTAHNRAHELVFIHMPSPTSLMGSCDAAMRMPEPALVTRLYANNLREPQVHEEKIWYKVHEKDELGRTVLHYIAGGLTDNRGPYYEGASNLALKRLVRRDGRCCYDRRYDVRGARGPRRLRLLPSYCDPPCVQS